MMDLQRIKQRFDIVGNSEGLDRAISIALQVAPTDLSVLITGESGTGKEVVPQIVHHASSRKHNPYIAVNCGAIPEGTIDSELFGHEKGSFTGAHESRKGYFDSANGGTLFLDEVAELPLQTQVRLLRVLETGEYIKVGSSKVNKTNVRIVAATNVNIPKAISAGKFREDLYYRLNTVPIELPPLRDRDEDVLLLFRRFAVNFSEKYRMPGISLDQEAKRYILKYPFPGNIRQLKNLTEQISIIETDREIRLETLAKYLPEVKDSPLPMVVKNKNSANDAFSEREILYKVLFELKQDIRELKQFMLNSSFKSTDAPASYSQPEPPKPPVYQLPEAPRRGPEMAHPDFDNHEEVEEVLSLEETEKDLIQKALVKHNSRRKSAAKELGISERTLYRKIKEYKLG
ncbi:MAG: transcriptional regulator with PAS, ATPase and Fis domain [Sphingobacteriales bacterium]|jgi:transcriptional regulator with PAS, ATPase and Fis domain